MKDGRGTCGPANGRRTARRNGVERSAEGEWYVDRAMFERAEFGHATRAGDRVHGIEDADRIRQ